ncbi:MAG TPA: PAS domain-containing sensor histidine kinase, partial [Steroidobacteraceae bacterium]|nr:PAS domain-containing sensor histidine kinase [Steroidobacteraceae bacterium]
MMELQLDFQLLFEESPEVLLVLLPDAPRFTMVAATRSRLQVTQATREQTIGKGLFEVFPDNPDDNSADGTANLRDSLNRVVATRAADTMPIQKYDIRDANGNFITKYWSPKNIPVLTEDGSVKYILHRVEDVTELVQANELQESLRDRSSAMENEVIKRSHELAETIRELRAANLKLGELDVAKTNFFSNISHEFRTPITLMLAPLEDALNDSVQPLSPANHHRLQLVHDNSLRLLKLVNSLLDFSRLEAGRIKAHYAPLDVAGFTTELVAMFHSAADKANIKLTIDCPKVSEPLWIDREMWEKIIPNLVSNALKFTFAGEIAVRLRELTASVAIEVSDTGIGIPPAELPRIFERFYRVTGNNGRAYEGTGIGLSLVRELVELHGGRVSVDSDVNRGTTFRIEIPKG